MLPRTKTLIQCGIIAAHTAHTIPDATHAGTVAAYRCETANIQYIQYMRWHRIHEMRKFRLLQCANQFLQRVTQLQVTCAIFQFEDPL